MDNSSNLIGFMGIRSGHQLHIGWIYPSVACDCHHCCSYPSDSGTTTALKSEKRIRNEKKSNIYNTSVRDTHG